MSVVTVLLIAAPAQAVVTEVAGTNVGLQPRNGTSLAPGLSEGEGATFANENGNVVLHGSASEYAIYWDPNDPTEFTHEWLVNLDGFFQALGEAGLDTPFGVIAQYRDRSNAVAPFHALFKAAYSDTVKFPAGKCTDPKNPATTCLTDAQLREQLQSFIATHGLPKGMGTVYYLLTPPGVTVCLDAAATRCSDYSLSKTEEEEGKRESVSYKESFCSYHSDINPDSAPEGDGNTILYAAIPWTAHTTSYDCQDGGWNPEKGEENREKPKELTKKEEEARKKTLEEDTPKKRAEEEETRALEGPHIEEPNQEGKGESGNYTAGLSDLLVNQIAEEEINTVTDPLLSSWRDGKGEEATDLCRNFFASTAGENGSDGEIAGSVTAEQHTQAGTLSNVTVGSRHYYVNNVFSLSQGGCSGGLGLIARFTAPNPVNAGEIIGVDGMESTVSLIDTKAFGPSGPPATTYATFSWNFGDGTPEVMGYAPGAPTCEAPWLSPCAASAFHSYQYGGTYKVTLTITDVDGDTTSVSHEVTADGPPRPSSAGSTGSGSSAGQTTQGTGSSTAAAGGVPAPIAAASIVRQTLRNALRKGLVVSYSVNEQVAGHFEVLLSSAVAHRLGIGGAPATGLPAGSPAEVVIAKAILVTTKGGRSAVHIDFSKRTAARLARVHKVSLMLRLVVRNAAKSNPITTTVVSSVTLSG
ncbi:MAG: PKD domain-containing protein [Solirubrobacteraceae bacterium]